MSSLHFNLGFVETLARHRTPLLTDIFLGASGVGSSDFYVLLIVLAYVAWDKRLAVRLSYLVLITMACNDWLKNIIRNPRPFVADGSYRQHWAVSPSQATSLATEYSTPSGHAMGAGSFYSYIFFAIRRRPVRIAAVLLIFVIGFSRPYLGVHYGEDILLGWAAGFVIAAIAVRHRDWMEGRWGRCNYSLQIVLTIAASIAMCLLSAALNGWQVNGQLHGMTAYAGFLTGNVIAFPLERRHVRFHARRGTTAVKLMRFVIAATMMSLALVSDRLVIHWFALTYSAFRVLVEYLGYAAAGIGAMFVAPWLFTRWGLAEIETEPMEVCSLERNAGEGEKFSSLD